MQQNKQPVPGHDAIIVAWRPALVFALLAYASPGHAYLDPGTGSIILQSLLAGIAVAMGILRMYWHRCKDFFATLTGSASRQTPHADSQEARDSNQNSD